MKKDITIHLAYGLAYSGKTTLIKRIYEKTLVNYSCSKQVDFCTKRFKRFKGRPLNKEDLETILKDILTTNDLRFKNEIFLDIPNNTYEDLITSLNSLQSHLASKKQPKLNSINYVIHQINSTKDKCRYNSLYLTDKSNIDDRDFKLINIEDLKELNNKSDCTPLSNNISIKTYPGKIKPFWLLYTHYLNSLDESIKYRYNLPNLEYINLDNPIYKILSDDSLEDGDYIKPFKELTDLVCYICPKLTLSEWRYIEDMGKGTFTKESFTWDNYSEVSCNYYWTIDLKRLFNYLRKHGYISLPLA